LNKKRKRLILVISAPSGAGKTTVVHRLLKAHPEFIYSVSLTTRSPRLGEKENVDYCFTSKARFKKLISQNRLAEWALVHGHYYGTLKSTLKQNHPVLLDIDVQGGRQIKRSFPEAILIFILPPSFKELKRRLVKRHTDDIQEINRRLRTARKELSSLKYYDYAVVNKDLKKAVKDIEAIIQAERLRVSV
jgi:guanylate kinase